MRTRMTSLTIVVLLFTVAIPVSAQEQPQTGSEETATSEAPAKKTCFNVRDVRSISAVEDRFVYVRCTRDQHYLLTAIASQPITEAELLRQPIAA